MIALGWLCINALHEKVKEEGGTSRLASKISIEVNMGDTDIASLGHFILFDSGEPQGMEVTPAVKGMFGVVLSNASDSSTDTPALVSRITTDTSDVYTWSNRARLSIETPLPQVGSKLAKDNSRGSNCIQVTWDLAEEDEDGRVNINRHPKRPAPSQRRLFSRPSSSSSPSVLESVSSSSSDTRFSSPPPAFRDCFSLSLPLPNAHTALEKQSDDVFWYGGAERYTMRWPLNEDSFGSSVFTSHDTFADRDKSGSVMTPSWITSTGAVVSVNLEDLPPGVELFTSLNNYTDLAFEVEQRAVETSKSGMRKQSTHKHTFQNQNQSQEGSDSTTQARGGDENMVYHTGYFCIAAEQELTYQMCATSNAKEAHQLLLQDFFEHPSAAPAPSMFEKPIWSTWAKYKMNITQAKTMEFASDIKQHGFPHSNLEIDDRWQHEYGDLHFDAEKFPAPEQMTEELHAMGFNVTLWVMPFVEQVADKFQEGEDGGYLLANGEGEVLITPWWQGEAAVLDLTNPQTREWFSQGLRDLKDKTGVDSFKFDAGESIYVPGICPNFSTICEAKFNVSLKHIGEYTKLWVELAAQFELAEVRAAWQDQSQPIFVREMDKDSSWGVDNGLESIITSAFNFGLQGYPYVLPDMIGGNGYNGSDIGSTVLPEQQLYTRWVQANALLPSMQFSFLPWHYDAQTIETSRLYVGMHVLFAPVIMKLAEAAVKTSFPLIRPMWWVDAEDKETYQYSVSSQFMLGECILSAPVVVKDDVTKTVYFPRGTWIPFRYDTFRELLKQYPTDDLDFSVDVLDASYGFFQPQDPEAVYAPKPYTAVKRSQQVPPASVSSSYSSSSFSSSSSRVLNDGQVVDNTEVINAEAGGAYVTVKAGITELPVYLKQDCATIATRHIKVNL